MQTIEKPGLTERALFAWPELLIGSGDLLVLLPSFVVLLGRDENSVDAQHVATWTAVLAVTWLFFGINQGAYGRPVLRQALRSAYVVSKATLIAGAVFYLLPLVGGPTQARVSHVGLVLALGVVMFAWRLLVTRFLPSTFGRLDLVVVGAGWAGQALAEAIARRPRAGWRIVAFVDDRYALSETSVAGIPVYRLDHLHRLLAAAHKRPRVVLANTGHARRPMIDQLTSLAQAGIPVLHMWSLYEEITGQTPVRHLGHTPWAVLPRPSEGMLYRLGKRAMDVSLAVLGLASLVLLLPILAVVLPLQTGGSPFLTQVRAGRHGRPIRIVKLRTLPVDQTSPGAWRERKAANRPSRFAALVRAAGLDELPQCWNVLRGEMSIVGPRPYLLEEARDLEKKIPFFRSRTLARPGLTGWAQINYGYGLSLEDEVEKLQYDLYYVRQQSTYHDLLIILRTIGIMLRRRPNSLVSLASVRPRRPTSLTRLAA
jgi:lipopolysaccharide/colanic/teichoic acid biosynthesis glycosyltransferase